MRRNNKIRNFFQQKQYAIASLVLFVAIAGMTGVYISNKITSQSEEQQQELAKQEEELSRQADLADIGQPTVVDDAEENVTSVTSVIQPKEKKKEQPAAESDSGTNDYSEESQTVEEKSDEKKVQDSSAEQTTNTQAQAAELHFNPQSDLSWPLQGDVILNFSMDQTVYFATLDQYKYNPALIIAGKVNDPVNAAAGGKITEIAANEETGTTVTMDLGDGYTAVYGQLKEVMYNEGAYVEAGNAIGYIAEPTKYYSVEGSNLYFELMKDGTPVNPLQYMQ